MTLQGSNADAAPAWDDAEAWSDIALVDNIQETFGLVPLDDVLALIRSKPAHTELVITGRNAHPELVALADLVTEMREVKHYYHSGQPARTGIES